MCVKCFGDVFITVEKCGNYESTIEQYWFLMECEKQLSCSCFSVDFDFEYNDTIFFLFLELIYSWVELWLHHLIIISFYHCKAALEQLVFSQFNPCSSPSLPYAPFMHYSLSNWFVYTFTQSMDWMNPLILSRKWNGTVLRWWRSLRWDIPVFQRWAPVRDVEEFN